MSGWFGGGANSGSQQKIDRTDQLNATNNLNSVFNYGMPQAQAAQSGGISGLNDAMASFAQMANGGRAGASMAAAPATNAAVDQQDAALRDQAEHGTQRSGGTVEANADASAATRKNIDDLLSKSITDRQQAGAQGEAAVGSTELQDASSLLGLGANAENAVANNSLQSKDVAAQLNQQGWTNVISAIGTIFGSGASTASAAADG